MTDTMDFPPDLPVIELVRPMPGFPDDRHFALVDLDGSGGLCSLRSLDHPDLRFLVAPPGLFFPDYEPELGDTEREQLGITGPEDAIVFCSVTLEPEDDTVYLNLMGPFVVHQATLQGRQLVLADSEHPVRAAVRLAEL